jgi:ssDNA-binding Zn-finger/Zn-ribbon topoisomerase 1
MGQQMTGTGVASGSWLSPSMDSCPQCGSAEIGTSFNRSDSSRVAMWECHCTDCRFKWSEKLERSDGQPWPRRATRGPAPARPR